MIPHHPRNLHYPVPSLSRRHTMEMTLHFPVTLTSTFLSTLVWGISPYERQQSSKSTSSYDLCQTHLSTRTVVVAVAAGGGLALGSLGGVRSTAPLLSYSDDVVPKLGLLPGNSK